MISAKFVFLSFSRAGAASLRLTLPFLVAALLALFPRAAISQDAVYFVAGPQGGETAGVASEGRLVRIDPGTGVYETVSGVVQGGPTLLVPPSVVAVYRDFGGPLYLLIGPNGISPVVRLLELPVGATSPRTLFEGPPPVGGVFSQWEFTDLGDDGRHPQPGQVPRLDLVKVSDDEFLVLTRLNSRSLTYFGRIVPSQRLFTAEDGVATSAASVDIATRSYLTLSSDLLRVERVYWDTGIRETLTTIDYQTSDFPIQPFLAEFSVSSRNQTAAITLRGFVDDDRYFFGDGAAQFEVDYSTPNATVDNINSFRLFDNGLDLSNSRVIIRIFGEFVTHFSRDRGAVNSSTERPLYPQELRVVQGELHSPVGRSFYYPEQIVRRDANGTPHFQIRIVTFNENYTDYSVEYQRIDLPAAPPRVVRGAGPPILLPPGGGAAQVLAGTVPGTVNVLHFGGLMRVDLATGARTAITTFPDGFNFRGLGAAVFSSISAHGTAARPARSYADHLIEFELQDSGVSKTK